MWIEIPELCTFVLPPYVTSLAEVWIEICFCKLLHDSLLVTSLAEVWIEIPAAATKCAAARVTSLAEVWIEMSHTIMLSIEEATSLPSRKCGLKLLLMYQLKQRTGVTSLAEVWIEICICNCNGAGLFVTSLAEVWIEICTRMDPFRT